MTPRTHPWLFLTSLPVVTLPSFQMIIPVFMMLLASAEAHSRWKCPAPRDYGSAFDNTGNKKGPCGPLSGQWGKNGITTLTPGPLTVVWEESISHAGSPWRISILDDNETVVAVVADHVPHWDASAPHYVDNTTYVAYHLTLDIPDISCEKCTLQLLNIMTDKTNLCKITLTPDMARCMWWSHGQECTYYTDDTECSGHTEAGVKRCLGASSTEPCMRADTCFSSYHSCTDVVIAGKTPVKHAKVSQPADWPFSNLTSGKYRAESASWEGGWLKAAGLPAKFVTPMGALCGHVLTVHPNVTTNTTTPPAKNQQHLRHGAVLGGGRR